MNPLALLALAVVMLVPAGASAQAESRACTMQYAPVCGLLNGEYGTYGNACTMEGAGASFVHDGECRGSETYERPPADEPFAPPADEPFAPPANCIAWFDGCNSCGRTAPGQPAMCTLMACSPDQPRAGYCTAFADAQPVPDPIPEPEASPIDSEPAGSSTPGSDARAPGAPAPSFLLKTWDGVRNWFSQLFAGR